MESLRKTALWLSFFTVAYNLIEGVASAWFAAVDHSPALLGFGVDSFVESLSGAVMIWRFAKPEGAEHREQLAAKLVGLSLVALAVYVVYQAKSALAGSERPERSLAALIIATLSLVVMSVLFCLKVRTGERLEAEAYWTIPSKRSLACSCRSRCSRAQG